MMKFLTYRCGVFGAFAIFAGAFVAGAISAEPLSRFELNRVSFEVSIPAVLVTIFILGCIFVALQQFQPEAKRK